MRTYLLTAPRWVVGLTSGLLLGAGMTALTRLTSPPASWTASIVTGVVTGTVVGGTLALTLNKQRRDLRIAAGDLPPDQLKAVYRAAVWGPIPADPLVREAAARVAQRRLEELRRYQVLVAILVILTALGTVTNLRAGNHGLGAALGAGTLTWISEMFQPRRLRRRIRRLSPDNVADRTI